MTSSTNNSSPTKHKLVFIQDNNAHGTCVCLLDSHVVDQCDMNYEMRYTQAHVVAASALFTLNIDQDDLDIQVINRSENDPAECGQYPAHLIKSMAMMLLTRDRENNQYLADTRYVRSYEQSLKSSNKKSVILINKEGKEYVYAN